ncbi:MAG: nitroreductase family protein [Candidatus Paceibacterota bacterium]
MIKKELKKFLPSFLIKFFKKNKKIISLFKLSIYDFIKFYKHSAAIRGDYSDRNTLLSSITMDYHRIEKGLSLPKTKPKFGFWFIPDLIDRIVYYFEKYGEHDVIISAINAIESYREFHSRNNISLEELDDSFIKLESIGYLKNGDGVTKKYKHQIESNSFSFKEFVDSRHSVRNFDEGVIDDNLIEEAISIAKRTPSVCNRQPWRVYSVKGSKVRALLEHQNGNRGFRSSIKNLLVVTGKISYMRGPIERHQIYIDGGLFSMSLMYALHSLNLGVCSLNWCVEKKDDVAVRKIIDLPSDEEIIMYLAVGYKKNEYDVATSPRLPNDLILKHIK